jgi:hypothetical protein
MVMKHLRKERFPRGTYIKQKFKKIKPCQVLMEIYNNAYKLELLEKFDISLIFNVVELYEFHEGEGDDEEGNLVEWKKILEKRFRKRTQNKEYYENLVKWRNKGPEDPSWVSKEELAHLRGFFSSIESTFASTWNGSSCFLTKDV